MNEEHLGLDEEPKGRLVCSECGERFDTNESCCPVCGSNLIRDTNDDDEFGELVF